MQKYSGMAYFYDFSCIHHSFLDQNIFMTNNQQNICQTDRNALQSDSSEASSKRLLNQNLSLGISMAEGSGMQSKEIRTSLKLDNQQPGQPKNIQAKEELLSSCSFSQRNEGIILNLN